MVKSRAKWTWKSLTGGCETCGSKGGTGMGQVLRVEASLGKALFRKGRPEHIYRRLHIYWREINSAKGKRGTEEK